MIARSAGRIEQAAYNHMDLDLAATLQLLSCVAFGVIDLHITHTIGGDLAPSLGDGKHFWRTNIFE